MTMTAGGIGLSETQKREIADLIREFPDQEDYILGKLDESGQRFDVYEYMPLDLRSEVENFKRNVVSGLTFGISDKLDTRDPVRNVGDFDLFGYELQPSAMLGQVVGSIPASATGYGVAGRVGQAAGLTGRALTAARYTGGEFVPGFISGMVQSDGDVVAGLAMAANFAAQGLIGDAVFAAAARGFRKLHGRVRPGGADPIPPGGVGQAGPDPGSPGGRVADGAEFDVDGGGFASRGDDAPLGQPPPDFDVSMSPEESAAVGEVNQVARARASEVLQKQRQSFGDEATDLDLLGRTAAAHASNQSVPFEDLRPVFMTADEAADKAFDILEPPTGESVRLGRPRKPRAGATGEGLPGDPNAGGTGRTLRPADQSLPGTAPDMTAEATEAIAKKTQGPRQVRIWGVPLSPEAAAEVGSAAQEAIKALASPHLASPRTAWTGHQPGHTQPFVDMLAKASRVVIKAGMDPEAASLKVYDVYDGILAIVKAVEKKSTQLSEVMPLLRGMMSGNITGEQVVTLVEKSFDKLRRERQKRLRLPRSKGIHAREDRAVAGMSPEFTGPSRSYAPEQVQRISALRSELEEMGVSPDQLKRTEPSTAEGLTAYERRLTLAKNDIASSAAADAVDGLADQIEPPLPPRGHPAGPGRPVGAPRAPHPADDPTVRPPLEGGDGWSWLMTEDELKRASHPQGPRARLRPGEEPSALLNFIGGLLPPHSRWGLGAHPDTKRLVMQSFDMMENIGRDTAAFLEKLQESLKLFTPSPLEQVRASFGSRAASESLEASAAAKRRVMQALDGKLNASTLSPPELAAYRSLRSLLDEVAVYVNLPVNETLTDYFPHVFGPGVGRFRAERIAGILGERFGAVEQFLPDGSIPTKRAFRSARTVHSKSRSGALQDYETDLDAVLYGYLKAAVEHKNMTPFLAHAESVWLSLPELTASGRPSTLAASTKKWARYVAGMPGDWRKDVTQFWADNELFQHSVDRIVSWLGDASDTEMLTRFRTGSPSDADVTLLSGWFDRLIENANGFVMKDAIDNPGRWTGNAKAKLAIAIDDIRAGMTDPRLRPVVLEKLYEIMVFNKLAGSASHFITNLTQISNTFTKMGLRKTSQGVADMLGSHDLEIAPGRTIKQVLKESGVLTDANEFTEFMPGRHGGIEHLRNAFMAPASLSEQFLRGSSFLVGYRDAVDRGLSHAAAIGAGRELSALTQFPFNRAGTPFIMHNAFPRFLLMFKNHPLHQLNFTAELIADAAQKKEYSPLMRHIMSYMVLFGAGSSILSGTSFGEKTSHPAAGLVGDNWERYGAAGVLGGPTAVSMVDLLSGNVKAAAEDWTRPVFSKRLEDAGQSEGLMGAVLAMSGFAK